MTFVEVRFPSDIAYGSTGGPQYSTDVVITQGGYEQRNSNWLQARAVYNVAHGVKTKNQLDNLIAFFRARRGRAEGFRFKDWTDFQANEQLLGTGNGTQTAFQLVKHYASGAVTETRTITKPVSGTVAVFLSGVLQNASLYEVNYTSGIVTFDTAPAGSVAVTANFEFDVPVRFDTDRLSASIDAYATHSWHDIPLVEIRL
jgi:uncharacterized protein (TIGR02217 family)